MNTTDFPYKDKVRELFSSDGYVHYYSATPDAIVLLARTGELAAEGHAPIFHVFESDVWGGLNRVSSGDISDAFQEDPAAVISKQYTRGMRLVEYVIKGLSIRTMLNVIEVNTVGKKAWKGPLLLLLYEAIVTGGSKKVFKQLEQEGIRKGQFRRALRRAVEEHDVPMMTLSFVSEIYEAFDYVEETDGKGRSLMSGYFKTDKIPIQYINHINYLRRDEWKRLTPEQREIIPRRDYPAIEYRCEESGLTDRAFLDLHSMQFQVLSSASNCKSIEDLIKMHLKLGDTAIQNFNETALRLLNNRDFGRSQMEVIANIANHLTSCEGCRTEYEKARILIYGA